MVEFYNKAMKMNSVLN